MPIRSASAHSEPRILVVDDDRLMLTILVGLIRQEGYEKVAVARDGSEALKKFLVIKPQIVFLDIEMPELDGIETLRAIKEYGINTQVVMISGRPTSVRVEASKEGGAAGFLVKPISQKRIGDAIQACLKRADGIAGDVELFMFS
jgi:two-component system chemotaxis response regulator CheY